MIIRKLLRMKRYISTPLFYLIPRMHEVLKSEKEAKIFAALDINCVVLKIDVL